LHHRDRYDLLYRPGGACLTPVPAEFGTSRSGTAVCQATRNLLLPGWDRNGIRRRTRQPVNAAPGGVPGRSGFRVQHPGTGSAWLVAGHRGQETGAGR
jgi:hypothetical protein